MGNRWGIPDVENIMAISAMLNISISDADNVIELNGIKSELVICACDKRG